MAQNIKLKRSALPGKVPTTSSIDLGELAINTYDGKVFFKKSGSVHSVETLVATNSTTTGSIILTQTGSFGELVITQDANIGRDIYVTNDIIGNGDIDIAGAVTASYFRGDGSALTNVIAQISEVATVTASFTDQISTVVTHNFNSKNVIVSVYDTTDSQIIPDSVTLTDTNNVTITFAVNQSGYAVVAKGGHIVSGSVASNVDLTSLNTFTSSQNTKNTTLATYTSSVDSKFTTVGNSTSSINTYTASLKTAFTASGADVTFNGNQIMRGALTVGTSSLGANENTLTLGPSPAGGTGEGGQIMLQASGGVYTSASMIDNYQNQTRLLRGTNAGSDAVVAAWNMDTKQMQLPAYNSVSAFAGTAAANLAVNSNGDVITVSTSGGSVFPYTGTAHINGGLVVTGSITSTTIIYAQANGGMYFQGGDDAALYDINVANTMGVYGVQDSTVGSIKLGSGGGTISGKSGFIGIGTINPTQGVLEVNGNIYATSFTGAIASTNGVVSGSSQIVGILSSLNSFTSSQDTKNSTLATYTGSIDTKFTTLSNVTGSLITSASNTETKFAAVATVTGSLITSASNDATKFTSLATVTGSLITSASNTETKFTALATYTASVDTKFTAVGSSTSSLNSFTSSASSSIFHLNASSASQQIGIDALNTFSGSQITKNSALANTTGSLITSASNSETKFSVVATYTASVDTKFTAVGSSTSSLNSFTASASSSVFHLNASSASQQISIDALNTFSGSQITKNSALANVTGSLITSASNTETKFAAVATYTGSNNTKWTALESVSSSFARTNVQNTFSANQIISGSLTVTQDLVVLGSSSITNVSSSTLNIGTNLITVAVNQPSVRFGGIAVIDSGSAGSSGSFLYDSVQDEFIFLHKGDGTNITSSHFILGPETYNNLGNETYLTNNRVPKGTGKEHLNDSNITDNGSVVSINSNTQVTGSLVVSNGITGQINSTNGVVSGSSQIVGILSSLNSYTQSQDTKNLSLSNVTASLHTYTASVDTKFTTLANVTASLLSYTSSQDTKNFTLAVYTASVDTKFTTLASVTASLNSKTGSYATTGSNSFTGSQTITGSLVVSDFLTVNSSSTFNKTISVKGGIYFGEFGNDQLLTDSNNYYSVYLGTDFVLTGLGDANTAIGYGIDEGNNDRSVMIGYNAGNSNSTAGQSQRNIAIGEYAALPGYGSDNISIGAGSFAQLISGSRNIAIGKNAGGNLISGSYNTLIGNVEFAPTTNVSNNIILADGQGNIKYRWDASQNNIYGNLYVSGAISGSGFSGSIAATNGVISGSSQITAFGFVSGSFETTGRGIISGSSQITPLLPTGTISGSSQVNGSLINTNTVTINGTPVALGGSATISITGSIVADNLTIGQGLTDYASIASSTLGSNTLVAQPTSSYTSAFFKYTAVNGTNARAGEVIVVWNGANAQYTDFSTLDIGNTTAVTASAAVSAGNVQLNIQTNTTGWNIKTLATFI